VKYIPCLALYIVLLTTTLFVLSSPAQAQDNYEIQVYSSEATPKNVTMVEIHSNFTVDGGRQVINGVLGTHHQFHETLEITRGITDWFETGLYVFTSAQSGEGWQWVGSHVRPRVRVPEGWKWPVGVSASFEFGYQRHRFSQDTWTLEIRPIVDKQLGRWYLAFNPAVDRSWHGPGVSSGLTFNPGVKVGYQFSKQVSGGFEYYGETGNLTSLYPIGCACRWRSPRRRRGKPSSGRSGI